MLKELLQAGNTEKEKTYNNKPKTIKKMVIGAYISITTLNVNGLNAPTKTHRLAEWIQKLDPVYMLSTGDPQERNHKFQIRNK